MITTRVWRRSCASRFDIGSSINSNRGSRTIALPIATRCCWPPESVARPTIEDVVELQRRRDLLDPTRHHGPVQVGETHREADVLGNGQVRIQRVLLERHGDVPLVRLDVVEARVIDEHVADRDVLQPRDHAQQRGLATPGRSDDHEQLALADLQFDVADRPVAGRKALAQVPQFER